VVTLDETISGNPGAFGDQLRRMREGAGLSLEDISAETKVSTRILGALEGGNFKVLPEKVFCRSFVAQYARTIGIDEGPLVSAFDGAWQEYTLSSGIHTNLYVETRDLGHSFRWRFWIPIAVGGLILAVAAGVILVGSHRGGEDLLPDPRRSGARQATATLPTRVPAPPTPLQGPTDPAPPAAEDARVSVIVSVTAGEECWIHFRDRDGMTGERLLADGQRVALDLPGPVKLTVGNAGAVSLIIDGRTYSDLGLPGQVIHTEVSRDGFVPLDSGGTDG
jgi:hypothetical protein